jgi:membrane fusion protein (multidrug efflux system)
MKVLGWLGVSLILLIGGYFYLRHNKLYPSTNDAYLRAHVVRITPQVTGLISQVPVQDYQTVRKGDLLFAIDPISFRIALAKAQANLALTQQQLAAAKAAVQTAEATVREQSAYLVEVENNTQRTLTLVQRGQLSRANADNAHAALEEAKAKLAAARSDLEKARHERGEPGKSNASLRAARTAVAQAELNLSYTKVYAPADGQLSEIQIRPGTVVIQDLPLFALVENREWWVEANFKETDLTRIRPGQSATITVDMYPDKTFQGTVKQLSPASGAAFSLLPPENATGNWVKITQRFPVKVIIEGHPAEPLRIGASSTVTVDTTSLASTMNSKPQTDHGHGFEFHISSTL